MPKPVAICRSLCFLILVLISVPGCSSTTKVSHESVDSIAKEKLGSAYTIIYNDSKQYALCQQKSSDQDHAFRTFKFIVVKIETHSIIKEGTYRNGYVKWFDAFSLEVSSSGKDEKSQTKIITINEQKS